MAIKEKNEAKLFPNNTSTFELTLMPTGFIGLY